MVRHSILKLRLQQERHVVHARQRARDIASLLGFDHQDQVRLATATSEITRNAFRYAKEGVVEFFLGEDTHDLIIEVRDAGPGIANLQEVLSGQYESRTGLGKGLIGTRRLMDGFDIATQPTGTRVTVRKALQPGQSSPAEQAKLIAAKLDHVEGDAFQEVERQNQDLLRTLAELREKQELLAQVNRELEDTNRGVVALYAELEQNATDLRRISDQKTSFLSNLSHEFRTPLNAILALCQILNSRSDGELSAEQEKQLGYIRKSASDLSALVDDLLDVAKVEAGKVDIRPSHFSVTDLFGGLRGMLRTLLTGTSVQLVFSGEENFPLLFTDEPKVSQILRNLIANALKFTERGHVHVSAQQAGNQVLFRVEDTGIGVAPQDQERIFAEFEQVSSHLQERVRGTGLGLPLSRRLAQLLGGTLHMTSEPGLGSTFTVVLPMHFSEGAEESPSEIPVTQTQTPRVLLVEDNLETRFIHQSALKTTGCQLLFAKSVEETRLMVETESPAAIVLDRMLNGFDALPLLEQLRVTGYRGAVIVVSVHDEERAALQAGADAFLLKPVDPALLADTLQNLLRLRDGRTLLLVDDDEINRYVLREALAPFGFQLLEVRSGREALGLLMRQAVDATFLDMSMPGLTGLETLRELRNSTTTLTLPVIVHTSKQLTSEETRAIAHLDGVLFPKSELRESDVQERLRVVLSKAGVL